MQNTTLLSYLLLESAEILAESKLMDDKLKMITVLEDTSSPVTVRYTEKLFQSVIDKGHIDFGDIPNSKGNIRNYSGYHTMITTLQTMQQLAAEQKSAQVQALANDVLTAVKNMENLSSVYEEGFRTQNTYVMLEYNTFTLCCVEATTTLLCEYVTYLKNPSENRIEIHIKNNKYRPNLLFIDQIQKFNKVNTTTDYRKFLEQMLAKEKDNFTGAEIVGMTAVMLIALSIVPITRNLIYIFYNARRKTSDYLLVQASFLELHKTCVEANTEFSAEKKEKILKKQEHIRVLLVKMADKIKVVNTRAQQAANKELEKDNKLMTFNNVKNDIDASSFSLL